MSERGTSYKWPLQFNMENPQSWQGGKGFQRMNCERVVKHTTSPVRGFILNSWFYHVIFIAISNITGFLQKMIIFELIQLKLVSIVMEMWIGHANCIVFMGIVDFSVPRFVCRRRINLIYGFQLVRISPRPPAMCR